jgi:hypothetical protein
MVFCGPQNIDVPFMHREKTFFSTLNIMVLQMVRNEHIRFGGHIDIQVNYKILQLEVSKKAPILLIHLAFKKGCFEVALKERL